MPTITFTLPVAGQDIDAGPMASNFADLQALLNGNLDGSNLNQAVAIQVGASGLLLGADVNLYRSAANVLKTDDQLFVGSGLISLGTAGDVVLYRSGADTLRSDDNLSLGGGIFFGTVGAEDVVLYRSDIDTLQSNDLFRVVRLFAYDPAFQAYLSGGSAPTLNIAADGKMEWGTGAGAVDTNLYRLGAGYLGTDSQLYMIGAAPHIAIRPSGSAQPKWFIDPQGKQNWGDGTGAQDTNLYRSAADLLKTDDTFHVVGNTVAGAGTAGEVSIGPSGNHGCIELGGQTLAPAQPFIDFHYQDGVLGAQDYNVRLQNSGNGILQLTAPNNVPILQIGDTTLSRTAADELSLGTGDTLKLAAVGLKFNDGSVQTTAAQAEVAYAERTSNLSITGSIQDLIDTGSVTYENVAYRIEFYCPALDGPNGATGVARFHLYDGGTDLGVIAEVGTPVWGSGNLTVRAPVAGARKLTPSAGSHQYKIRAIMTGGTGTAICGAGGAGNFVPAYCRIVRA